MYDNSQIQEYAYSNPCQLVTNFRHISYTPNTVRLQYLLPNNYVNSLNIFICCRMSGWYLNEESFKRNHKVFTLERNKLQLEVKHNNDSILSIEMRTCDTGTFSCFSNHRGFYFGRGRGGHIDKFTHGYK